MNKTENKAIYHLTSNLPMISHSPFLSLLPLNQFLKKNYYTFGDGKGTIQIIIVIPLNVYSKLLEECSFFSIPSAACSVTWVLYLRHFKNLWSIMLWHILSHNFLFVCFLISISKENWLFHNNSNLKILACAVFLVISLI